MKGNPFPKKSGAFKQDIQKEYDEINTSTYADATAGQDSLNLKKENLELKLKQLQDEYTNFMDTYNVEFDKFHSDYEDRMKFVSDSLQTARDADIKLYEDKKMTLEELLKKRPNLKVE
tara:strand:+ start:47 stop:400 length:354 start_codon:yes stop_codon:yes gene_type:complete